MSRVVVHEVDGEKARAEVGSVGALAWTRGRGRRRRKKGERGGGGGGGEGMADDLDELVSGRLRPSPPARLRTSGPPRSYLHNLRRPRRRAPPRGRPRLDSLGNSQRCRMVIPQAKLALFGATMLCRDSRTAVVCCTALHPSEAPLRTGAASTCALTAMRQDDLATESNRSSRSRPVHQPQSRPGRTGSAAIATRCRLLLRPCPKLPENRKNILPWRSSKFISACSKT